MSNKRREKRKLKPSSDGKPFIPLHKRKVQKSMQNKGGYYEGMPGVTTNPKGERKIIDFIITPEGKSTAYMFAHPMIVKRAIQNAFDSKEIESLVGSAFVDKVFSSKWNVLYFIVRLCFRYKQKKVTRVLKRRTKKQLKELENLG